MSVSRWSCVGGKGDEGAKAGESVLGGVMEIFAKRWHVRKAGSDRSGGRRGVCHHSGQGRARSWSEEETYVHYVIEAGGKMVILGAIVARE